MPKVDRRIKRSADKEKRKYNKKDKWEDLMEIRSSCIESYIQQHQLLVETEKQFKDKIQENEELKLAIKGLNDTYVEIAGSIKTAMDKHIFDTVEVKDGKVVQDYKKGIVKINTEEYLDYMSVYNDYAIIMNNLINTGTTGYTALLDKLKVFSDAVKEEDVELVKQISTNAQQELIEAANNLVNNEEDNKEGEQYGREY